MRRENEKPEKTTRESSKSYLRAALALSPLFIAFLIMLFAIMSGAGTTKSRVLSSVSLITFGLLIYAGLVVAYVFSTRGSISLDDARVLGPGSYDDVRFSRFREALEAVSLGKGVRTPEICVVDAPAPLAYIGGTEYQPSFMIAEELLEADLTTAEIEAIVAVLLAKTIVHPAVILHNPARELEIDPAIMGEISRVHGSVIREDELERIYMAVILADTVAVRQTLNPGALEGAIMKCAKMLKGRQIRVHGLESFSWCAMFVGPPIAGLFIAWGWTSRSWKELTKLRLDNLEMIKTGKWHPSHEIVDRLS